MSEVYARLDELLIDRATFDLDPDSEKELELLLDAAAGPDFEEFEFAAAAIDLALQRGAEPMPAIVRTRLLAAAIDGGREEHREDPDG